VIAALVPAKALDQAKQRLAAMLSEAERRALALAMLEDVVRALQSVQAIDSVNVVSPDAEVLERAAELGAATIAEPASVRGINQALGHALSTLEPPGRAGVRPGPDAVLAVLADVPAAAPSDFASILDEAPERGVVIVPSSAKGTSALFLRPPGVIPFRFGELSFQMHKREAAARRIEARVLHIERLEHDIDEPDDLRRLLEQPAETATHRLLAQLSLAPRLA
jgi:2-phospho-L-lactate guanylyltransferase